MNIALRDRGVPCSLGTMQQRSYGNTGEIAPTYYLQTDAPPVLLLYRCLLAMAFKSLTPEQQAGIWT